MKKETPASLRAIVQKAFDEFDKLHGEKKLKSKPFRLLDAKSMFAWKKLAEHFNNRRAA